MSIVYSSFESRRRFERNGVIKRKCRIKAGEHVGRLESQRVYIKTCFVRPVPTSQHDNDLAVMGYCRYVIHIQCITAYSPYKFTLPYSYSFSAFLVFFPAPPAVGVYAHTNLYILDKLFPSFCVFFSVYLFLPYILFLLCSLFCLSFLLFILFLDVYSFYTVILPSSYASLLHDFGIFHPLAVNFRQLAIIKNKCFFPTSRSNVSAPKR